MEIKIMKLYLKTTSLFLTLMHLSSSCCVQALPRYRADLHQQTNKLLTHSSISKTSDGLPHSGYLVCLKLKNLMKEQPEKLIR